MLQRLIYVGFIVFFLVSARYDLSAQNYAQKIGTPSKVSLIQLEGHPRGYTFSGSISHLFLETDPSDNNFIRIIIPEFTGSGVEGSPELPVHTRLYESSSSSGTLRITHMDSMVLDLDNWMPGKVIRPVPPPVRKSQPKRSDSSYKADSVVYSGDNWVGGPVLSLQHEGRMRGVGIASIQFRPVAYHPASNTLKIYYNVRCQIETDEAELLYRPENKAFKRIMSRIERKEVPVQKALRVDEPLGLVIVSDTMFRDSLQTYIRWKRKKGFHVTEAYTQDPEVGTSRSSIKAYLEGLYRDPPAGTPVPSYLLIVGDVEQVPLSQSGGEITDLYYAEFDGGGDYIPEIFYGRISVKTNEQLRAVTDKILEYEQYAFPDPSFLGRSVLVAGVDGSYASTYGNGQINYAHDYYLNSGTGMETYMFPYPQSGTSASEIRQLVSEGVGFVNYTGHGLWDRWMDPAFRKSDIPLLENEGMYPVMIGNGCETNYFTQDECFAEALIRAPGKGALAYIGCTNDSYWDEDYYWAVGVGPVRIYPTYEETGLGYYDKIFHTRQEDYEIWTPSLGEMIFGGNMAVQESNTHRKKFYWEIYQLAGDPTLVPWFGLPDPLQAEHPALLPAGTSTLDVHCPPNAYLALSMGEVLLDARHASTAGIATLSIPDTLSQGTLELVITGERLQPYTAQIPLGISELAFPDLLEYQLSEESIEADSQLTPGENSSLDVVFVNRGGQAMVNDTLILRSHHPDLVVQDSLVPLELLGPGDSISLSGIFLLTADEGITDQDKADLELRVSGAARSIFLRETLAAPVLGSQGVRWEDRSRGNGNGIMENEEWISFTWTIENSGHFRSSPLTDLVVIDGGDVDLDAESLPEVLMPGSRSDIRFYLRAPKGKGAGPHMVYLSAYPANAFLNDSVQVVLGQYVESFENLNTHNFPFAFGDSNPWRTDSSYARSSGYSLRSANVGHLGRSSLSAEFETESADTLSFYLRVSSEANYDVLILMVDSTEEARWSGELEWQEYNIPLSEGIHQVEWIYRKDGNTIRGEDAAWIDEVRLPSSLISNGDLSLIEITDPSSGPWLGSNEAFRVRVRNTSAESVEGFSVRYSLQGKILAEEYYDDVLEPGQEGEFSAAEALDLSAFEDYYLEAEILSDTLAFAGNNSNSLRVSHYVLPDLALTLPEIQAEQGQYANLHFVVENRGNTVRDSLHYLLSRDGSPHSEGTLAIGLQPGESVEKMLPLVYPSIPLDPGIYDYSLSVPGVDSVAEDNSLSVRLYWYAVGQEGRVSRMVKVWPNPAVDVLHVRFSHPSEDLRLEIVDGGGRIHRILEVPEGRREQSISLESLDPGTYWLRRSGTGEFIGTFIKTGSTP